MSVAEEAVAALEEFFEDAVTQTPIKLRFTASEAASYISAQIGRPVTTSEVSSWLQIYRSVQGGQVKLGRGRGAVLMLADYVIATYMRGRRSVWFILAWPNMRSSERAIGQELLTLHEIMATIKEDVQPMVRNVLVQFAPAVIRQRAWYKAHIPVTAAKLQGYLTMLLQMQHDVRKLPPALRSAARMVDANLARTIAEVDSTRKMVLAL